MPRRPAKKDRKPLRGRGARGLILRVPRDVQITLSEHKDHEDPDCAGPAEGWEPAAVVMRDGDGKAGGK